MRKSERGSERGLALKDARRSFSKDSESGYRKPVFAVKMM